METSGQFSPEDAVGPFSFEIGEEAFGFDGGFTEGKFVGQIRGADGKEFAGLVEDLGDGRYRIEDWEDGRTIESPAEAGAAEAEVGVGAAEPVAGLEEAAAVAGTEAEAGGLAGYKLIEGEQKEGKLMGRFESPDGTVWEGIAKLDAKGKVKIMGVKAEDAAAVAAMEARTEPQPAPVAPVAEEVAGLPAEVAEPAPIMPPVAEIPEPMAEPAVEPEAATAEAAAQPASLVESVQQVVSEMKSMVAAKDIFDRKAAGKLLTAVEIAQMEGQDGTLIEARLQELKQKTSGLLAKIHSKVAVRDLQEKRKSGLLLTAVEIATIKTAEPIDDEEYAELKRLEQELEVFPPLVPEKPPDEVGEIGKPPTVPEDPVAQIRRKQAEKKLLTQWELAQLSLADEAKTSSPEVVTVAEPLVLPEEGAPTLVPEPALPPEPIADAEPVVETVAGEAVPEVVELPVVEPVEMAGEPAPVETPIPGRVVVDAEEQARVAAARPAGAVVPEPVEAPMPEVSVQPETAGETPELRFERRKQGFAGALAELDLARGDTSGTEREQKVRLAEAFNQAIGSAMELMEEGDEAKEVVREFFAGALGTPGGRKLTEVAVRSRMDETGVFQAATPEERKKKLEEAGLWGLLTLLLELGMSFTDKTIGAVVSEVQSATGGGK